MFKYIGKRIVSMIPVVFVISVMLFGMFKSMPGDPVRALMPQGGNLSPEQIQAERQKIIELYGFDKPLPVQYAKWIGELSQGNLGVSTQYKRPAIDVIKEPMKNTIILNIVSLVIAFMISIPVGIKSAVKRGSTYDNFWQVFSLVGMSVPTFFIAMVTIFIFAIKLGLFPIGGMPSKNVGGIYALQYIRYITLPVFTLTLGSLASVIRYVRNAMIEALSQDYIRTARSKGLSEKVVIYHHAFRNALIPIVTLVAGSLVSVFGGSMITEKIFAFNGIGTVMINAINNRDFMIVLALNMFYSVLALFANLLMDLGYALVDPRVKLD